MKNEGQVSERIEELRAELKLAKSDPNRHKRGKPGHRGNLGTSNIRILQGEIRGLLWVLDDIKALKLEIALQTLNFK